jgi:predicted transcriptional regulator YheO
LARHLDHKAVQSRSLDYNHAKANNPDSINEYFELVKTIKENKIKSSLIFNMDEKGFLIGLIQMSMKVIISASEKNCFHRQPGNHQTITIIEAIGMGGQDIPPMVILKDKQHQFR